MKEFQLPRHEVPARLLLDDGRQLDCCIFTAERSRDGGAQSVADRLNEGREAFLPVSQGEDEFLLNKSGIVSVEVEDTVNEVEGLGEQTGREVPVRLSLAGGTSLVGRLYLTAPPPRGRVIDHLNDAGRFLAVLTQDRVTLIQRSYIVSVLSED